MIPLDTHGPVLRQTREDDQALSSASRAAAFRRGRGQELGGAKLVDQSAGAGLSKGASKRRRRRCLGEYASKAEHDDRAELGVVEGPPRIRGVRSIGWMRNPSRSSPAEAATVRPPGGPPPHPFEVQMDKARSLLWVKPGAEPLEDDGKADPGRPLGGLLRARGQGLLHDRLAVRN